MQVGAIKMAHWTDLGKLLKFAIRFGVEFIEALGMVRQQAPNIVCHGARYHIGTASGHCQDFQYSE